MRIPNLIPCPSVGNPAERSVEDTAPQKRPGNLATTNIHNNTLHRHFPPTYGTRSYAAVDVACAA